MSSHLCLHHGPALWSQYVTLHPGQFPLDIPQVFQAYYVPNWHHHVPHTCFSCIPWLRPPPPANPFPIQYFGVIQDSSFSFTLHIQLFKKSCNFLASSLKSIFFLLSPLLLLQARPPLLLHWILQQPPPWSFCFQAGPSQPLHHTAAVRKSC